MKKVLVVSCLLVLVGCQNTDVVPDNAPNLRALSTAEATISSASNDFAFNLFKKVQAGSPENSFISPISVSMALAMTLNGAEGETQQSILNTIDFGDLSAEEVNQGYRDLTALLLSMDRKIELGIANSVWYSDQYHVKQAFSAAIEEYYDGKVSALNFSSSSSKDAINNWVEDKTNKRIKNLIDNISPEEIMFLVNAIYFKGDWTYQFNKSKTHSASFHRLDGSTTQVDMMHSDEVKMRRYSNDDLLLLEVPYGNQQFNLTLIIPDEPNQLAELVNELSAEKLSLWLSEADTIKPVFELPKFKMTWKKDLKGTLGSMGMHMYDFPNLFEEDLSLEITRVIHQSYIDVNEKGTEAAAATAVGVGVTSLPPEPEKITVDKPFLFLIREKHSSAILFMGQLIDPAVLD